jgi:outer membrane protein
MNCKNKKYRIWLGIVLLCQGSLGLAAGILDLYQDAKVSDPQYAAAKADWDAVNTLGPQALGQLLPQISLSGSRLNNDTTNEVRNTLVGTRSTDYDFTSRMGSLNLTQALIRPQAWISYLQSKDQLRQADGQLRQASQDLILRLAQAYFEVLLAEDNVGLTAEQKTAISEQLKQAKRYFEAGVGTITDINEVQARYDTIAAQELAAQNTLEIKIRAIEQLVGKVYRYLAPLGSGLVLELPEPANMDQWLEFSLANNPQLQSRQALFDSSQQEVYKNFAAHLPTVDLVASRGRNENASFTLIDNLTTSQTIGIQVSVPIFSGGTTQARVNQASAQKEKARYELETVRRATIQSTRQEYLNVVNGVAQVRALQQAVKSNELAFYSAKKGQEAGVRTSFDVLNTQQLLFSAKRDLAQERYRYVISRLKLRSAAGLLDEEDVILVQRWLSN